MQGEAWVRVVCAGMAGNHEGQLLFGEEFTGDVDDAPLTSVPVVAEPLDLAAGKAGHLNELVDLSIVGELSLQQALLGMWLSSPWSPCPTL